MFDASETNESMTYLLWAVTGVIALVMTRTTASAAPDFTVFWNAARAFWEGRSVYACGAPEVMGFKYPPWILPVFLPFGKLDLEVAKWVWGGLSALVFVSIVTWLSRRTRPLPLTVVLLAFVPLLNTHAFDGQITLWLLAAGLWGMERFRGFLVYPFSAKIFTLFPLLGLPFKRRDVLIAGGVLIGMVAFSLPALWVTEGRSPVRLFECYKTATAVAHAADGSTPVHAGGMQAQGFVSVVVRMVSGAFEAETLPLGWTLLFTVGAAVVVWGWWSFRGAKLSLPDRWIGWLAWTATVQPLGGFHSFVLALPLAAVVWTQVYEHRNRRMMI
jgi:hypothetical protein